MRRPARRPVRPVLAAVAGATLTVSVAASVPVAAATAAAAPSFGFAGRYVVVKADPDAAGGEVAAVRGTRMLVVNGTGVDVVDVADPAAPVRLATVDLSAYGASVTSVAAGALAWAVALPAADKTAPGTVLLLDRDGRVLRALTVGALPDQVVFSKNGRTLLVANEGEPTSYGLPDSVDPEGSVTQVDVRAALRGRPAVRTITFTAFDEGGTRHDELPAGVRLNGPGARVAQDLEPEYVAFDPADDERAYVTLQENNAVAVLRLGDRPRVQRIRALGGVDHSVAGSGIDASDRDGAVNIRTWPVTGLHMPDAVAAFERKGETFTVTANEGDARDYDGFADEARVSTLALDPAAYPDAAALQANAALGRLTVSTTDGLTPAGTVGRITAFGTRSVSIWDDRGRRVYDSGDLFEQVTSAAFPASFNADNTADTFDNRSDNKGPEPEGVAVGRVGGRTLAFVGLERIGGVVVLDVTDPTRTTFVQYVTTRVFGGATPGPDLGPEVVSFVDGATSPTGGPLVVVSNEVSGTVTFFAPTA